MDDADELTSGRDPLKVDYFSRVPMESEFRRSTPLPLRFAVPRRTRLSERDAIVPVLMAFEERAVRDDLSVIESYVSANPDSTVTPWIEANIAFLHYRHGRFGNAFEAYGHFWDQYKDAPFAGPDWNLLISNAALQYAELCALFGRHEKVASLIAALQKRPLKGINRTQYLNVAMTQELRLRDPTRASNCGALAVYHLNKRENGTNEHSNRLANATKGSSGFSLTDVADLAQSAKLNYHMVKRRANQALPLPCIVHWKEGHFAIVTEKRGDLYRIEDPAFEKSFLVSEDALSQESEGHFLVANFKPSSSSLKTLSRELGQSLRGKTVSYGLSDKNSGPCPQATVIAAGAREWPGHSLSKFRGGFQIHDIPIWVENPYGVDATMRVTYSRTETRQPMWSEMSHLGEKEWYFNWAAVAIEQDAYSGHQGTVQLWLPSGRKETYEWDSGNDYLPNPTSGATLEWVPASSGGPYYLRTARNHTQIKYGKAITTGTTYGHRYYVTEIRNANGASSANSAVLTVNHSSNKISSVVLPNGVDGLLFYHSGNKITQVSDKGYIFRHATFGYGSGTNDLISITDPVNIKSEFQYTSGDLDKLITPSTKLVSGGHIKFEIGTVLSGSYPYPIIGQYTEVTDALGYRERVEYSNYWNSTNLPGLDSNFHADSNEQPSGTTLADTQDLNKGTTLYWDKKAMPTTGSPNTSDAYQYHWMGRILGTFT